MRSVLAGLLALVAATLGGCGGGGANACNDVVDSPGGPVARACVYAVPNGATVDMGADGGTIVTVNGKVVATYPPCPCASLGVGPPRPDGAAEASAR